MKNKGASRSGAMEIPVKAVLPNPEQPRTRFDEAELRGLAQSIKANSLIQPIVVERGPKRGQYTLIDGERRWRAVQMLRWTTIQAVVRDASNHAGQERLVKALVANVQRTNLDPIEKARALQKMVHETGIVSSVVRQTGLSSSQISLLLSLLRLSPVLQKMYQQRLIPSDPLLPGKFLKLSHAEQERVASVGVTRGGTARTFIRLLNKALEANPPKGRSPIKAKPKPKLEEMDVELEPGAHFDALALVKGWKSLPRELTDTARRSCQACELYDVAGHETCRRCALPDFLVRLKIVRDQQEAA